MVKKCSVDKCNNIVVNNNVCMSHGALRKICLVDDCNNVIVNSGVCTRHGAKKRLCTVEGCMMIRTKNGVCDKHGERRTCKIQGCSKHVVNNKVCVTHGAKRKTCSIDYCNNCVVNSGVCIQHGAKKKLCTIEGCTFVSKKNGLCQRHGADRPRCSISDCKSFSRTDGLCQKHGAKKRICSIKDCTLQVQTGGICKQHRTENQKCKTENCNNYEASKGLCYEHHPDYKCINCNVMTVYKKGNICGGPACKGKARTKEYKMVDYIKEQFQDLPWVHNKQLEYRCDKYRPDLRVELDDRMLFIECDEEQHRSRNISCEIARMVNLQQDTGLPTIFIRWNPDKYDGNVTKGERLQVLYEKIYEYIDLSTNQLIQGYPVVEYLFYDTDRKVNLEMEMLIKRVELNL